MQHLLAFLEAFAPLLALAVMLATLVCAISALGRRFERHDDWLRMLDARVENLTKDRKATWARKLQRPYGSEDTELDPALPPLVPPPLPPRAPTLNAADWSDDESKTEDLTTRKTGRYPHGAPPKGPEDDDDPP